MEKTVEAEKLSYSEYWKKMLGKAADIKAEINDKLEELVNLVMDAVEKHDPSLKDGEKA